jgi:ferric-dicitrate binding protein FerR (iron transport regulator)
MVYPFTLWKAPAPKMHSQATAAYCRLDDTENKSESSDSLLGSESASVGHSQSRKQRSRGALKRVALGVALAAALGAAFLLGWSFQPSWNQQCIDTEWSEFADCVVFIPM